MKKIISFIFISLFIFSLNSSVYAKTVKDLKNELADLKQQLANQNNKKAMTQNEISNVSARIKNITTSIANREKRITDLSNEINELEESKIDKDAEIKNIISYMQVTNSNNAYLEYVFGASTITDLIFRSAISEQLVNYNEELITKYTNDVKSSLNKQVELKDEIEALDSEQGNLSKELIKLGDNLASIVDVYVDIKDDIKSMEKQINYYTKTLGCKDSDNISTCGKVPYSGKMIRPLISGQVTSNYGWRKNPVGSGSEMHYGMDLSGGDTKVYAAAPGTVAAILSKTSCGGNMIYINHNINGTLYTTGYYHLEKVMVKVGQIVDQNTQVGKMGGGSSTPWDRCTTGRHLHFAVGKGTYSSYNSFISKNVNPRNLVNFPAYGVWFSNRTSKY